MRDTGSQDVDTGYQVGRYSRVSIAIRAYTGDSCASRKPRLETFPGIDFAQCFLRPARKAPVTPLTGAFLLLTQIGPLR